MLSMNSPKNPATAQSSSKLRYGATLPRGSAAEENRRDLEIINRRHARLNREAEDVLTFQGDW